MGQAGGSSACLVGSTPDQDQRRSACRRRHRPPVPHRMRGTCVGRADFQSAHDLQAIPKRPTQLYTFGQFHLQNFQVNRLTEASGKRRCTGI